MVYPLHRGKDHRRPFPKHVYSAEAWRAAVRKTGRFLLSANHHERDALTFALYWMKKQRIFDGPALLVAEHPEEGVRAAAEEIRKRR